MIFPVLSSSFHFYSSHFWAFSCFKFPLKLSILLELLNLSTLFSSISQWYFWVSIKVSKIFLRQFSLQITSISRFIPTVIVQLECHAKETGVYFLNSVSMINIFVWGNGLRNFMLSLKTLGKTTWGRRKRVIRKTSNIRYYIFKYIIPRYHFKILFQDTIPSVNF